jgi:hypothetical protein
MSDEHKGWTIPGEVMQQVLDRLPDDWNLTIQLQGGSIRPYLILTNDNGDGMWNDYGPLDGESVVDCISRLMRLVSKEGGDDE